MYPVYLSDTVVSENKMGLITLVALAAYHTPNLVLVTAPRVLVWDYLPTLVRYL
jgi:hypothetical protein